MAVGLMDVELECRRHPRDKLERGTYQDTCHLCVCVCVYIYIYIERVPGEMCQTSRECSLS